MSSHDNRTPTPPSAGRIVACPSCKGDSVYAAGNPYRPFCSARCKNLDFGAWASESYRMESAPGPDESPSDPELPLDSEPRH